MGYKGLVKIDIFLRLLLGPLILVSVPLSVVANFVIDWADGEWFKRAGYKRSVYSLWDKWLDTYWYCWIMGFLLLTNTPYLWLFALLFGIRMVGLGIYFFNKKEETLFFFPNFFEVFYYAFLIFGRVETLGLVIPIVMVREYILHVKKMNLSWFFTGKTTYWVKG